MRRRRFLAGVAATVSLTGGCSGIPDGSSEMSSPTPKPMTRFTASEHPAIDEVVPYELAIHEKTNNVRNSNSAGQVEFDGRLSYVSRRYSRIMAEENQFGHSVRGKPSLERLKSFGMSCMDTAENIYKNKISKGKMSRLSRGILAKFVIQEWLNSGEGHRENLLNPEWNYEGVGVYVTAENEVYVTQTFTARDCEGPGDPPRYGEGYDG